MNPTPAPDWYSVPNQLSRHRRSLARPVGQCLECKGVILQFEGTTFHNCTPFNFLRPLGQMNTEGPKSRGAGESV